MTSDFRSEMEMWPFCACAMHPAIIRNSSVIVDLAMGQPQNVFLVYYIPLNHLYFAINRQSRSEKYTKKTKKYTTRGNNTIPAATYAAVDA